MVQSYGSDGPTLLNINTVVATHLICVNVWGQKSAFVLQLLNLTCVLGFMTSPLLVKPFLHTASAGDNDQLQNSSSHVAAPCISHSTNMTKCDVTVT